MSLQANRSLFIYQWKIIKHESESSISCKENTVIFYHANGFSVLVKVVIFLTKILCVEMHICRIENLEFEKKNRHPKIWEKLN